MIIDINYSDAIYKDKISDERIDTELIKKAANLIADREIGGDVNEKDLLDSDKLPIYIGISIVSADEIRELNAEFRGLDKVTDVLSFPQYENKEDIIFELENNEENIDMPIGDVVICLDQAENQSKEYGTTIRREVTYLFVHSVMHLLGYDHMNDEDKKIMRAHEEYIMDKLDIKRS